MGASTFFEINIFFQGGLLKGRAYCLYYFSATDYIPVIYL